MVITLDEKLEKDLKTSAEGAGVTPEEYAREAIRRTLLENHLQFTNPEEWKRRLRSLGQNCGVPLPGTTYSREEIYD